jgi:hypothetical protein
MCIYYASKRPNFADGAGGAGRGGVVDD